jgi:acyl-coenzyme A synthetase/AMP-(fatty) acid ligase
MGATAQDIRGVCKQSRTGYKVPRHVSFRCELPKAK